MIRIGTSGFSYKDWKGHFYPERLGQRDFLEYYARSFSCVEINSTYYAVPRKSMFESMIRRTPDSFVFTVKANQEMTHVREDNRAVFLEFLNCLDPLVEEGRLGCVLLQFPWSFRPSISNSEYLRSCRQVLPDLPMVVEFRNESWIQEETFTLLREEKLGFCVVDLPRLKGLPAADVEVTSDIGYVRFHGRNWGAWWKHEQPHERYDYLYSEEELIEWLPKIAEIEADSDVTYVMFNNHFRGQSAMNARMLASLLPEEAGVLDSTSPTRADGAQLDLGTD